MGARRHRKGGQATVEFSLALPLFLLLLLGALQVGLYGLTRGTAITATERGVRVAVSAAVSAAGLPATSRVYAAIQDQLRGGLVGGTPALMSPEGGRCPPLQPSWPAGTVYVCSVASSDGTVEVAVRGWVHALVPPSFGLGSAMWRMGALPINVDEVAHAAVFAP